MRIWMKPLRRLSMTTHVVYPEIGSVRAHRFLIVQECAHEKPCQCGVQIAYYHVSGLDGTTYAVCKFKDGTRLREVVKNIAMP